MTLLDHWQLSKDFNCNRKIFSSTLHVRNPCHRRIACGKSVEDPLMGTCRYPIFATRKIRVGEELYSSTGQNAIMSCSVSADINVLLTFLRFFITATLMMKRSNHGLLFDLETCFCSPAFFRFLFFMSSSICLLHTYFLNHCTSCSLPLQNTSC